MQAASFSPSSSLSSSPPRAPLVLPPAETQEFKKKFEEVQQINAGLITAPATKTDEESKAADELAKEVEKL